MRNDRGGVIVGYFTKIAVVLVAFSILCFDAVSVGVARISIEDTAKGAARAAADEYGDSRNQSLAYRAAVKYAEDNGATVAEKSFKITRDGTISVRVVKEATTLLVYRLGKTEKWAHVEASASTKVI